IDGERAVRVDTFPMGIHYEQIRDDVKSDMVQQEARALRDRLGNPKVVLSLDRLDYTKGIKHRLEAYATFLERYTHWLRKGVLNLSEMAGASRELGEALIINPNDESEIVDALKTALEMPEEEQIRRNQIMQNRLGRYDVIRWGQDFTGKLHSVKDQQRKFSARLMDKPTREKLIKDYTNSENRILFLDYNGTLSPYKERP